MNDTVGVVGVVGVTGTEVVFLSGFELSVSWLDWFWVFRALLSSLSVSIFNSLAM